MTIDEIKGITEEEINLEILGILNEEKEINLREMTRECEKADRKLVKMVKLLKISAYLNGRDKVDFSDLMLLTNCLWNNPENIEKVTKLVLEAVKRNVAKDEE